ncbi:MAG: T9SS type A sorting domain-containing protein [Bacteroidia bacterium]
MKKTILFSLAVGCTISLMAQDRSQYICRMLPWASADRMPAAITAPAPVIPMTKSVQKSNPAPLAGGIVSRLLGQESNAFGTSSGTRQYLWADPTLNTIILTHRVVGGSNTGFIGYDVSKNNGKTWMTNAGPVYQPDGDPKGLTASTARFPQGGIYNPTGNVIADSCFMVYFVPTRDASNPDNATGDWGGHAYGVNQIGTIPAPTQHQISSSGANGMYLIPDGFTMTKQGKVYSLDYDAPGKPNGYDMNDTLVLTIGTWSPSIRDMVYSIKKVYFPVGTTTAGSHSIAWAKISMADDGLNGYISANAHPQSYTANPDSAYSLLVSKTTDGGMTWSAPQMVDVNGVDPLLKNSGYSIRYTTAFDHDAVVDGSGNLHMVVDIGTMPTTTPNGFSISSAYGNFGVFDIYTTDGGVTWRAKLLGMPHTFRGSFGVSPTDATNPTITEDQRAQASRTYTGGQQLFFTYFESDSALGGGQNTYPNMISVGYDESSSKWTAAKNFTLGSPIDSKIIQGSVSYYVFTPSAGVYTIPCSYSGFKNSDPTQTGAAVQLNYIDSAQFVTADFNVTDNSIPLVLGIQEYKNNLVSVSQNYPNPYTGLTSIDVSLQKSSDMKIEITNMLGQLISVQNHKSVPAGVQTYTLDASNLNAGIYFYTIRTNDSFVTRKMTVK